MCSKREASEEEIGGGYEYSETGTGMSCHDARVVAWRRSEDFLVRTNTHLLFGGGVDPRDICKGVLADEWLLGGEKAHLSFFSLDIDVHLQDFRT